LCFFVLGTFVVEYVGVGLDDEEYQKSLLKKHEEKDENYYFLTIDSTRIIDAGPKGNVSRLVGHSVAFSCVALTMYLNLVCNL